MRVASANSGRPESPPDSFAVVTSFKFGGRVIVVLPTIMPSTRRRRAAPTTSSSSFNVRSGAILTRSGVSPACRLTRARVDHAGKQLVEQLALLQVAQAGRVGRRDVDREVARHRREGLDQAHIIGDAILASLVCPHMG